jgi:hypothetical protein
MNSNQKNTFSKPMIIDELKQLTKVVVAEHEQYKTGALNRKRQVEQRGNILK